MVSAETNNTLMKAAAAEGEAAPKDLWDTHLQRNGREAPKKIQRWSLEGTALH